MVTPAVKREAVVHLRSAFEASERRACSVIEVASDDRPLLLATAG